MGTRRGDPGAVLLATLAAAAGVLMAGCTGSVPSAGTTGIPTTTGSRATVSHPASAAPSATSPSQTCGSTSQQTAPPAWATSAAPAGIPAAVSANGLVSATIFANPLHAPARTSGATNKILWVVKLPREGQPLEITATPLDHNGPTVTVNQPADSSPGEIYPSIVDVPTPGCWQLTLAWAGHRDTIELRYQPTT